MPNLHFTELFSVAFFIATALLLAFASTRVPDLKRRLAALTAFVTCAGGVTFMMASYDGRDGWWQFEKPGPIKRRQLKDRGYFEFEDEEASGPAGANGGSSSGPAAAAGNTDGAGGAPSSTGSATRTAQERGVISRVLAEGIAVLSPTAAAAMTRTKSTFADCADCPELVIVLPGYFTHGAVKGDGEAAAAERPSRTAAVRKAFAIGRTEVTIGQFAAFARDTGLSLPACAANDLERDKYLPVACITWRQANAYLKWLTARTGRTYRLPTEAEWVFAARGGANTAYTTGFTVPDEAANLASANGKRMPVGSFPANAIGLRDVHGNVAEMVADCWTPTLARTERDANRVNVRGDCRQRVLKDAGASEAATYSRLSARRPIGLDTPLPGVGFRVAREL